jgi:hypothetical protein
MKNSRLVSVVNSASDFTVSPTLAVLLMVGGQAEYVDESSIRLTEFGARVTRVAVTATKSIFDPCRNIGTVPEREDVHPCLATFGWQLDAMGA